MTSTDKAIVSIVVLAATLLLGLYAVDKWHAQAMERIENAKNVRAFALQVEYEKAKADQARYRAIELGYLCAFTDEYGVVYESDNCKSVK